MNHEARKQLIEIVKKYGIKILDEPRKVEGLLRDFCGDCKREIFSIVNALKEGAGNDLMNSSKSNTVRIAIGRLSSKMQSDLGMSEEVTVWSIESIAIALGIMNEKEASGATGKAQVEQKPVEVKPGGTYPKSIRNSEIKTSNGDELIYVEGGSFVMGDTGRGWLRWDEKPIHKVELTYDFYVGKYPVTFEEHDRYCMETAAKKPFGWVRGRRPVIDVSWFAAIEYCNWLSEKEGLPKAYDSNGNLLNKDGRITADITKVLGYRLLTEAEWEYAARGGKKSMGYKYSGSNSPDSVAWYRGNSGGKTHEVGQKKRNELGLCDMSGNVYEWCSDWYESYSSSAQTNPYNNSGSGRVCRGGGWGSFAASTRVAFRSFYTPTSALYDLGFRIARTVQ